LNFEFVRLFRAVALTTRHTKQLPQSASTSPTFVLVRDREPSEVLDNDRKGLYTDLIVEQLSGACLCASHLKNFGEGLIDRPLRRVYPF
jgi:hypothetical protein